MAKKRQENSDATPGEGAILLDEVKSISLEQGKLMGKLLVTFQDDSSIDFDVQKTVKPGPFVDAFHAATGR